ncbi:unnamed protein product [Caenorhabditis angaria]|uniref:Uncharacterized protein n=1 Tax=Caenorhabditis angaria TaxID=860376 RepID=A0A9P1MZU7_9PELO|nr:unnamed protein product [Caenorhabditis angaria]
MADEREEIENEQEIRRLLLVVANGTLRENDDLIMRARNRVEIPQYNRGKPTSQEQLTHLFPVYHESIKLDLYQIIENEHLYHYMNQIAVIITIPWQKCSTELLFIVAQILKDLLQNPRSIYTDITNSLLNTPESNDVKILTARNFPKIERVRFIATYYNHPCFAELLNHVTTCKINHSRRL